MPNELPFPLRTLMHPQWNDAWDELLLETGKLQGLDKRFDAEWAFGAREQGSGVAQTAILNEFVDELFRLGEVDLALSWQLLAANAKHPETVQHVLPQVVAAFHRAVAAGRAMIPEEIEAPIRERLDVWHDAANGDLDAVKVSIFAVAANSAKARTGLARLHAGIDQEKAAFAGQGLVVMRADAHVKVGQDNVVLLKNLNGVKLPLAIVGDLSAAAAAMWREYPHAIVTVQLLMQDLRQGQPAYVKPVLLLGPPGCGKSRMVRRMVELIGRAEAVRPKTYNFDASGVSDGMFSGSSKAWSNSTPSIPTRAIASTMTANPFVAVDDLNRGGTGAHNGNMFDAMLAFLDRETSQRYRETALDTIVDLSHVSYIATANDVDRIPRALMDRFRILKVPSPTEAHVPMLAVSIMEQMAVEDGIDPGFLPPLERDEIAVITRVWRSRQDKSIRSLQKMIRRLSAPANSTPQGTDMSLEDKQRIIDGETAVTMLFAGREPSADALERVPLLYSWTIRMDRCGQRRTLSLVGFRRTAAGDLSMTPGELIWMDRKDRFAITYVGLWRLGEREDEIGMLVPPMGED